ncbi:MAG: peptidoglycan-binding domain-containing protein [Hyphomicrobiaceae bacterium]
MPLSPMSARLALVAFLAICGSVGTNLLVLQTPAMQASGAKAPQWKMAPLIDADQLGRKALEALIGSHTGIQGMPVDQRERREEGHRVGSFAPSSGNFAQIALPGGDPGQARKATIRSVQLELKKRGYEPGTPDGMPGLVTRAAVMAYEHDQGLPLTAEPSPEVLAHLRHGTSAPGAAIGLEAGAPRPKGHADEVIRAVQQGLGQLGYLASRPDGLTSDETIRAIREFEMDSGLIPTGRISGPLMARLAKQTGGPRTQ